MSAQIAHRRQAVRLATGADRHVPSIPDNMNIGAGYGLRRLAANVEGGTPVARRNHFLATAHQVNLQILGSYAIAQFVNASFNISAANIQVLSTVPAFPQVGLFDAGLHHRDAVDAVDPTVQRQQLASYLDAQRANYLKMHPKLGEHHFMSSIDSVAGNIAVGLYEMTGNLEDSQRYAVDFRNEIANVLRYPERAVDEFDWEHQLITVNGTVAKVLRAGPRTHCDRRTYLPNPDAPSENLRKCLDCPSLEKGERKRRIVAAAERTTTVAGDVRLSAEVHEELGQEFRDIIHQYLPDVWAQRFEQQQEYGRPGVVPSKNEPGFAPELGGFGRQSA